MTILSLAIQNTYQEIEIALLRDATVIDMVSADKTVASKQAIPLLSSLLTKHATQFNDITFIAVNQGPGPFTTLRVIIATVNGLSFASKVPLIGIDGMQALVDEYRKPEYPLIIALLDAFNKDVYFAIEQSGTMIDSGYKNITILTEDLKTRYQNQKIMLLGNAAQIYKTELLQALGDQIHFVEQATTCSIEQIGKLGFERWQEQKEISYQLFPLYLKHQQYKNQLGELKSV